MRSQSIRSVFRGLLVAGLLVSSQTSLLDASWKDRILPFGGTCFIHDLPWDRAYPSATSPIVTRSLAETDSDLEAAATRDNELCLAASEAFEFQMQVEAVLATLQSMQKQCSTVGARLFLNGSSARNRLISIFDDSASKFIQWFDSPDSPDVSRIETPQLGDFGSDWNCGDWASNTAFDLCPRLPSRNGGNVFVFAIDASPTPNDLDIQSDTLCNPTANTMETHCWQVGIDPVCPEINDRNAPISWRDSILLPSVCCPIGMDNVQDDEAMFVEALPEFVLAENRPPVLDAECEEPQPTHSQEWMESESDIEFQVEEQTHFDSEAFSSDESLDSSPYAVEEKYQRTLREVPDHATRLLDSLGITEWAGSIGKRFALSSFNPRVPMVQSPVGGFSREDLFAPPKSRSLIFDSLRNTFSPIRNEATSSDEIPCTTAIEKPIEIETTKPVPIATPESLQSHSVADSDQVNFVSKYLANRIRTVGLLLIDLATQLDYHQGQVEIAGGTKQPVR